MGADLVGNYKDFRALRQSETQNFRPGRSCFSAFSNGRHSVNYSFNSFRALPKNLIHNELNLFSCAPKKANAHYRGGNWENAPT